jgi:tRNA(fMet)-specific endonuclease VapC
VILLDTNAVIGLTNATSKHLKLRYREALTARLTVAVSSIVLFELQYGIARSSQRRESREQLDQFLAGPVVVAAFDAHDALAAGEVRASLAGAGTPIGPYDTLIAGQALRHGATLVTGNTREFKRVKGLKVEDWGK